MYLTNQGTRRRLLLSVFGVLMLYAISACEHRDQSTPDPATSDRPADDFAKAAAATLARVEKDIDRLIHSSSAVIDSIAPTADKTETDSKEGSADLALAELNKLRQFEYKIIEIQADAAPAEFEEMLNQAGREFWECFASQLRPLSSPPTTQFFCRRRPATPLRFVPQAWLGR